MMIRKLLLVNDTSNYGQSVSVGKPCTGRSVMHADQAKLRASSQLRHKNSCMVAERRFYVTVRDAAAHEATGA